ncbi:hypothetical protein [Veillonella sp.]|uniref:hypothetical protein n=1 Tax=Veillonella sp. TaxID=1926307 RepID=UPI002907D059|nr:hypothetical protein [Veillonella sp.]MDU3564554.1 hypothetical protein [Veillonella sp.]MDU3631213.1 hypothetical protein [Veillonella sp.]MDU3640598.1 hypothetical protein [Veillonella sp.]
MHIHLPLVLEAIVFSWIALYWLIYKILLRKKLSPLLVSLIANSDYGFMKLLSWSAIITYPFMLFSMFYFLDYIAVPIVLVWFLQPVFVLAVLLKQPPRSRYYEWARKKQMYVVLFIFAYIMSALILLKVNKLI